MIKTVKRGRQTWTLCHKSNLTQALNYISWVQSVTGIFRNVTTQPYHGHIYNPDKVIWIVEG